MGNLIKKIAQGFKSLGKYAAFTATAALALALAVGANSAAFHINNTVPVHPASLEDCKDNLKSRRNSFQFQSNFEGAGYETQPRSCSQDSTSSAGTQNRSLMGYMNTDGLIRSGLVICGR